MERIRWEGGLCNARQWSCDGNVAMYCNILLVIIYLRHQQVRHFLFVGFSYSRADGPDDQTSTWWSMGVCRSCWWHVHHIIHGQELLGVLACTE